MVEERLIQLDSGGKISATYLEHAQNSFLAKESVDDFLTACGRPLRTSVRVNILKISVEAFLNIADHYAWRLTPIPWCAQGFWLEDSEATSGLSLGNTPEHIQGLFYVQEASSMLPTVALFKEAVDERSLIADMAAAPGSKTTQLAAMMNNKGIILANELSASRLKSLHHNLIRCGVLNTCLSHIDARKIGQLMPEQFDYVLLDAPCGGEGTVRKDRNALADWQLSQVKQLAELQKELILSAYTALKPGGRMVYSTCTLSKEENQDVAAHLLQNTNARTIALDALFEGAEKTATPEGYLHVLPHTFDSEGFFVACFDKPESLKSAKEIETRYDSPFIPASKSVAQQLQAYWESHFEITRIPDGYKLLQRDKAIWLFPQSIESVNCYLKVNRAGIQIAQIYPNKIRSTHEMACCLGHLASRQIIEISDDELELFLRGQNITIDQVRAFSGEVLLSYRNKIVGIAQNQKGKLKNRLPRELVKDNYRLVGHKNE